MFKQLLIVALMAGLPMLGAASALAAVTTETESTVSQADAPTKEEIATLRAQAKASTGVEKETQERIQALYDQALEQLDLALQWSGKAKQYRASQAEAPDLLRRLDAELAQVAATDIRPPESELPLPDLEQRLLEAESALEASSRSLLELRSEKARRGERRMELPGLLTAARERLEKLELEGKSVATPLEQAQEAVNRTRRLALSNEIDAYEQELRSYDARGDLLDRRLELAERRLDNREQVVVLLSQAVDEQRTRLAEAALRAAEREVEQAHPALRELALQNLQLTRLRGELSAAIEQVRKRAVESNERLRQMQEESDKIESRVAAVGLTHAIGQFLRKQYTALPKERSLRRSIRELRDEVSAVQTRIIELEDQQSMLRNTRAVVERALASLDPSTSELERNRLQRRAQQLVADQVDDVDELTRDYGIFFSELIDLDVSQRKLLAETEVFAHFIEEKILWIKSARFPGLSDVVATGQAVVWLLDPGGWVATGRSVVGTVRANPTTSVGLGLLVIVLLGMHLRLRSRLRAIVLRSADIASARLWHALHALLLTFAVAGTLPLALWFLAWLLATPYESSEFAKAIATGLRSVAIIYFTVETLRRLTSDTGMGARIFHWDQVVRRPLYETLTWAKWILVAGAFLAGSMDFQGNEAFRNAFGRLAFIVPMIVLAMLAYRIAHPTGSFMSRLTASGKHPWVHQLRYFIYGAAVGIPGGLAIASLLGYYYTAYYLSWRFVETIWILLALLLFDALSHYWLKIRIRQRALEDAAEAAGTPKEIQSVQADGMAVAVADEELDAATISTQASQILRTLVVAGAIAGGWLIWSEALPALSVLDQVELWSSSVETAETVTKPDGTTAISKFTQQVPITLADLGLSLLLVVVAFIAARNLPGLMEIALLERLPLAPSVRYAITSLSKYTIAAIGIVMAFNAIGVSWAKVQWLVAAMTVGLAFGLQEIFANLVSGIIILFERPIRVGDVVTVGNVSGTVSRIRIRATTITDFDRKELIVPNKHFITQQVLNWTLSDAIIRVTFPISVSRGSEVDRVKAILMDVATEHPMVLKEPGASVIFKGFGPGALQFDLRVFIRREDYAKVLDALNTAIEEGLKRADIEIAVDRQEIQVRPAREDSHKRPSLPYEAEPDET